MLVNIIIILALVVGVFVAFVVTRSSEFRVTRSATMKASPERIFPQVNDFHHWNAWSPWAKIDPETKYAFSGAKEGVSASMAWDSKNANVGAGSMTIVESVPSEKIILRLDFLKPMKATNMAEFTFKRDGDQTVVTWDMLGKKGFIAKAMMLFLNCGEMVGAEFDKGLASMKEIVEAAP